MFGRGAEEVAYYAIVEHSLCLKNLFLSIVLKIFHIFVESITRPKSLLSLAYQ